MISACINRQEEFQSQVPLPNGSDSANFMVIFWNIMIAKEYTTNSKGSQGKNSRAQGF